jgi:hypothetical protein
MHSWLRSSADTLSAETGVPRDELDLTAAEIDQLLDFAAVAAHNGGTRTNAPLACFLIGVAHGQSDAPIAELVASLNREPSSTRR